MKNLVISACMADFENNQKVNERAALASHKLLELEKVLKSKLPQDEASNLINQLYMLNGEVQQINQEEYFKAGFDYGRSLSERSLNA